MNTCRLQQLDHKHSPRLLRGSMAFNSDVPAPFSPPAAAFFLLPNMTRCMRLCLLRSSASPQPLLRQRSGAVCPAAGQRIGRVELLQREHRLHLMFYPGGVWPSLQPADVTEIGL